MQGTLNTVDQHQHQATQDVGLIGNYISGLPQQSMNLRARPTYPPEDATEVSADEVEEMLHSTRRHHGPQHSVQTIGQPGIQRTNLTIPMQQGKARTRNFQKQWS